MPLSSSQFLFGKTRNWVSQNNIRERTLFFILSLLGKDLHIIWLQTQKSNPALCKENNSAQVILLGIFQVSGFESLFPTRCHIILFKVNNIKKHAHISKTEAWELTLLRKTLMDSFPRGRTWSLPVGRTMPVVRYLKNKS